MNYVLRALQTGPVSHTGSMNALCFANAISMRMSASVNGEPCFINRSITEERRLEADAQEMDTCSFTSKRSRSKSNRGVPVEDISCERRRSKGAPRPRRTFVIPRRFLRHLMSQAGNHCPKHALNLYTSSPFLVQLK